tara:strand:- start:168 stop:587 length:420 start_codon:yes stop_codon:yes gene_type:complete
MKPMPVKPGEHSDYETLLDKANQLEKAIEHEGNNDVHFEDVSGSNVRAQHYWTNGEVPPVPETVEKNVVRDDNPPGLNYNAQSNPHQTGSSLGMHITDGGSGESVPLKKSATLLGAWSEDNPFSMDSLVKKVEDLSRRL